MKFSDYLCTWRFHSKCKITEIWRQEFLMCGKDGVVQGWKLTSLLPIKPEVSTNPLSDKKPSFLFLQTATTHIYKKPC